MRFQMSSQRDRIAEDTEAQLLAIAGGISPAAVVSTCSRLRHGSVRSRRAPSRSFVRARPLAICRAGVDPFFLRSRDRPNGSVSLSPLPSYPSDHYGQASASLARVLQSTLSRHIVTAVSSRLPRLFPLIGSFIAPVARCASWNHGHEPDQAHSKTQRGGAQVGHDCELARPGEPFLELFVGPPQQPAPRSTGS